jgi:hypothetical protein
MWGKKGIVLGGLGDRMKLRIVLDRWNKPKKRVTDVADECPQNSS